MPSARQPGTPFYFGRLDSEGILPGLLEDAQPGLFRAVIVSVSLPHCLSHVASLLLSPSVQSRTHSLSKISNFILSFTYKKKKNGDFLTSSLSGIERPNPTQIPLYLWLLKRHVLNLYLWTTEKIVLNSNVIKLNMDF